MTEKETRAMVSKIVAEEGFERYKEYLDSVLAERSALAKKMIDGAQLEEAMRFVGSSVKLLIMSRRIGDPICESLKNEHASDLLRLKISSLEDSTRKDAVQVISDIFEHLDEAMRDMPTKGAAKETIAKALLSLEPKDEPPVIRHEIEALLLNEFVGQKAEKSKRKI